MCATLSVASLLSDSFPNHPSSRIGWPDLTASLASSYLAAGARGLSQRGKESNDEAPYLRFLIFGFLSGVSGQWRERAAGGVLAHGARLVSTASWPP